MKWLVLVIFLVGCTAVYISGDNNSVKIQDSIDTDADIEKEKTDAR